MLSWELLLGSPRGPLVWHSKLPSRQRHWQHPAPSTLTWAMLLTLRCKRILSWGMACRPLSLEPWGITAGGHCEAAFYRIGACAEWFWSEHKEAGSSSGLDAVKKLGQFPDPVSQQPLFRRQEEWRWGRARRKQVQPRVEALSVWTCSCPTGNRVWVRNMQSDD